MADKEGAVFDRIMETVGNDGKFQRRFNFLFNFTICMMVSMSFMNVMLVLNDPEHWCYVPGRNETNYTIEEWRDLVLPMYEFEYLEKSNVFNDTRPIIGSRSIT